MSPLEMNPEIRARWTAALRSGDYRQGSRALATEDGEYCCLGVLCDLAVRAGIIPAPAADDYSDGCGLRFGDARDYLPLGVTEWAGLAAESPVVGVPGGEPGEEPLAFLNDNGIGFGEIADLIDGTAVA